MLEKFPYLLVLIFYISVYFSALIYCFSIEHQKNLPVSTKVDLNAFSGCIIHIINFPGLEIHNAVLVEQPILISRYVSDQDSLYLLPIEIYQRSLNKSKAIESLQNQSENYKYILATFSNHFRTSSKNLKCEANIYLHPPRQENVPEMYFNSKTRDHILKDPFWISYAVDVHSNWAMVLINNVPKYSLLVCDMQSQSSICYDNE